MPHECYVGYLKGSVQTFSHFRFFVELRKAVGLRLTYRGLERHTAMWLGANSFCLLPYARIAGIIWLARTAVKVERSEFILNLDGGRSQPYRFYPGRG
jgi:hypothetical protein